MEVCRQVSVCLNTPVGLPEFCFSVERRGEVPKGPVCVWDLYGNTCVFHEHVYGEGSICCVCSSVWHLGVRVRMLLLLLLGRGGGRTEKLRMKIRGRR